MLILGIDTSSVEAGVTLVENGVVRLKSIRKPESTHSRDILALTNRLLDDSMLDLGGIDLLSVSTGPGSFTGLRIGIGTMMGLADSLGKPLAGAGTLDAVAYVNTAPNGWCFCPVMRAHMGKVYAALYEVDGGAKEKTTPNLEIYPEDLADLIDRPVLFAGDGFAPYREIFREKIGFEIKFVEYPERFCVEGVALLAHEFAVKGKLDDHPPEPVYVSRSQAEINWEKHQTTISAGENTNAH